METPDWSPLTRAYENERIKSALSSMAVVNHPLLPKSQRQTIVEKPITPVNLSGKRTTIKTSVSGGNPLDPLSGVDPLGGSSNDPLSDPLSNPLSNMSVATDDPLSSMGSKKSQETRSQNIEIARQTAQEVHQDNLKTPWQLKKQQILKDYTVSGNITLSSSAINDFAGSGVEDGSATRYLDKYNQRLASLERRQISSETIEMTQKEYEEHVGRLSTDLNRAWANDERVGSLKIAIQLAKLLSDTTVPQFYPSIFVMVTDVLDRFGDMVFNRLKNKAEEALNEGQPAGKKRLVLAEDFTSNDVPQLAKETCRNWFYKTACIRELLPRIYVEISLFKCYRFLTETDFAPILSRLGSIIRGIGDPLVSLYARTYLVVVGIDVAPQITSHALSMLQDVVFTLSVLKEPHMQAEYDRTKITAQQYAYLLSPGVEWVLKCVGRSANREVFQSILQMYRDHSNDALILKHVIDSFDATYYAHGALGMVTLIKSSSPSCFTHVDLFSSLGRQLGIHPPPEEQRLPLLNEVWKVVSKSTDLLPYVRCSYVWLDIVQKYYTEREMFVLLSDLSKRVQSVTGDLPEPVLQQLEAQLTSLIGQSSTFGTAVLTSEHLLKILDVFKGNKKVALCKEILESFKSQKATSDAVLINTLFDLGRTVHDSVDCLSPVADIAYISSLLCAFMDKIDFGRDLEQQLNFFVECRGAFCNLDLIKDKLILCVSGLAMKTFKYVKGKHSKKTSTFVKACLAYCHITIPSITDTYRKLELLLLCAQVALVNQCLPQTDTFLKAAISLIPDMPSHYEDDGKRFHYEDRLATYLLALLATLVVTPGHPEHGPFYIVQGLINAVPKYQWQAWTGVQTKVYTNMLALLCTFAQKRFPYHVQGVESNDDLYGGGGAYMSELNENINVCVGEIFKQLTSLGERTEASSKVNQAKATLDLVNQLASRMELSPGVCDFVLKLLELANRNKALFTRGDVRYFTNTVEFVVSRAAKSNASPAFVSALKTLLK